MCKLDNIKKYKLKKIKVDGGDVYHGVKSSDSNFTKFGESYFSFIYYNKIKCWKIHKEMTLNLVAPIGNILFNFIDYDVEKIR